MNTFLRNLKKKKEVDRAIKETEEKVLVLRFGKSDEIDTLQIDEIFLKTAEMLSKMAEICVIDIDDVPVYTRYFDITHVPATVFFFNGQHIKVDYGSPDHTKFIGAFQCKQDFIDLIEVVYRGAMRGKLMVTSPIDKRRIPKYDLIYQNI